jgi:hypothetical protein
MSSGRSEERNPCHELIKYTVVVLRDGRVRFLDLSGKTINRSKNGLCFITRYPLYSGCVLEFKDRVFQCSQGIVIWIKDIGGIYMAGTKCI